MTCRVLVYVQRTLLCACFAVLGLGTVYAGQYPDKPIQFIVPGPPGGGTDLLTRIIASGMEKELQQTVIVENKPGAGGVIGSKQVARATPDGYTILMGHAGTHAISPFLHKPQPYDPISDFTPITLGAVTPDVVVVTPALHIRSLPALIKFAKANPGKLLYGSSGVGSTNHLMGLLFSKIVGVQMTHVPYKGSPQALTDLVAGRISLMFPNIPAVSSYLKSGKLRPIAVTSLERSPALPEIPTFNELGFKGFEVLAWYGVFAPANLPAEIQAKLCDAINRVLKDPDARKRITSLGFDAAGGSSANFKEFVRKEVERWSGVIKEAGVAPAN